MTPTDYLHELSLATLALIKPRALAVIRVANHLLARLNTQVPGETLGRVVQDVTDSG
jgi:hypothetical protein